LIIKSYSKYKYGDNHDDDDNDYDHFTVYYAINSAKHRSTADKSSKNTKIHFLYNIIIFVLIT